MRKSRFLQEDLPYGSQIHGFHDIIRRIEICKYDECRRFNGEARRKRVGVQTQTIVEFQPRLLLQRDNLCEYPQQLIVAPAKCHHNSAQLALAESLTGAREVRHVGG